MLQGNNACSQFKFGKQFCRTSVTATRGMLVSSAIAALLFFAVYLLTAGLIGNHGLWLAQVTYLAMRGAVQTVWYRKKISPKLLL